MGACSGPRSVHDRLIKRAYGRTKAFAVVLRRVLPRALLASLDLRTLRTHTTETTDERLRGRLSDLCFAADLVDAERRRVVYFPCEHHSSFAGLLPLRAVTCATALWVDHLADHPDARALPLVVPIVLTQPRARNTPTQLSAILDIPPHLREAFSSPVEAQLYVDDLSVSVLDDPVADPVTLARMELARAFLYAHHEPASLTKRRLAQLVPLFEVLLSQREPLAHHDVHAVLTYVLRTFPPGSPVLARVRRALHGRPKIMFESIADSLREKGRRAGLSEGRRAGLSEGRRAGLSEGLARAVLGVLAHRFSPVPAAARRRVSASRDEQQLQRWFERALVVTSVAEVFGEGSGRRRG